MFLGYTILSWRYFYLVISNIWPNLTYEQKFSMKYFFQFGSFTIKYDSEIRFLKDRHV
jgi:hypothetical protein